MLSSSPPARSAKRRYSSCALQSARRSLRVGSLVVLARASCRALRQYACALVISRSSRMSGPAAWATGWTRSTSAAARASTPPRCFPNARSSSTPSTARRSSPRASASSAPSWWASQSTAAPSAAWCTGPSHRPPPGRSGPRARISATARWTWTTRWRPPPRRCSRAACSRPTAPSRPSPKRSCKSSPAMPRTPMPRHRACACAPGGRGTRCSTFWRAAPRATSRTAASRAGTAAPRRPWWRPTAACSASCIHSWRARSSSLTPTGPPR
mmetsp:Transcript_13994/g.44820  ORF Transcript_13994/g.44820 Transcript_13994/m.44820 type:complete len:269 (-) Transcript_13994:902-1708(-)